MPNDGLKPLGRRLLTVREAAGGTVGAAASLPSGVAGRGTPPGKRLLTVGEAGQYVGVQPKTLYNWVSSGKIACVKAGARCLRFDIRELDRWIDAHRVPAST